MNHADMTAESSSSEGPLKGWHVLLMLLGFFGVMFAVNGVFLYHAITSFPGEDVKKSYVQGLNYNDTLSARAAQSELGWRAEAGLQDGTIIFRLRDADDAPITGQVVVGELRRLATQEDDMSIAFAMRPNGEYLADGSILSKGRWLLTVTVMDADSETGVFKVEKSLDVS